MRKIKERILNIGLVKFLMRVFQEFGLDDGATMAAGIAYYTFLSIFPLVLALIGALGLFLESPSLQEQVFSYLRDNIPGAADVLQNNLQGVINLRGTLGIVGIVVFLWSGSTAVSAVAHAINRAWDIPREIKFYLKKPRDIGLTILLGILFLISLGASAIFNFGPLRDLPIIGALSIQVGSKVLAFLLFFSIFLILFKLSPNTKTYWRYIWFGALVTAVLFVIGSTTTFLYLINFSNYSQVYGSVASVIILLVWIYYSAFIVVIGAEFTAEYGRIRRGINRGLPSHSISKPANA